MCTAVGLAVFLCTLEWKYAKHAQYAWPKNRLKYGKYAIYAK
jgi:hypothetical protein